MDKFKPHTQEMPCLEKDLRIINSQLLLEFTFSNGRPTQKDQIVCYFLSFCSHPYFHVAFILFSGPHPRLANEAHSDEESLGKG